MSTPSFQHRPLWARIAIERLDACSELRTQRQLDEFLDAYAKTYGTEVDETTRTAAKLICRQRFGDSFKELPVPVDVPPGTLRVVRLAREGALSPGDLVATRRLGECEVARIHSHYSIEVRSLATAEHYLLSGLDFGADARVVPLSDTPGAAA